MQVAHGAGANFARIAENLEIDEWDQYEADFSRGVCESVSDPSFSESTVTVTSRGERAEEGLDVGVLHERHERLRGEDAR